ncbi:glycosyl transferase [bacterium 1XD42-94]|jgi:hypothetical protein|nr:glycosyl transferase [bacterium 1XD42-76]NBK06936.1 glycosyl transferase [bacterium 1XD42-94]
MKLISFYLPQFHEIPENNRAWGRGFTEWVNVKKAQPLFLGHNQPRKPLHNHYYNLLDDGVMEWQIDLAKKAGIYGFCFYHYWFGGRMVLEKPAEKLLHNEQIDFQYCFSWANEPWTRTWHGAGGEKEILIPQDYGGEEEWNLHYEYFRQFFMDKRYIKEENCPVLLIYRLRNIPHFNDMLRYWNECAKKDGFSGIFIVSMDVWRDHVAKSRWVNGSVDFEPGKSRAGAMNKFAFLQPKNKRSILWNYFAIRTFDYGKVNRKMLHCPHQKNEFRTVFVDFDDSPRRGNRAVVTLGSTPKRFGKYLRKALQLSRREGNEYLFINAWNEWGEGNYLEPDTRYGYSYLNQVKEALQR